MINCQRWIPGALVLLLLSMPWWAERAAAGSAAQAPSAVVQYRDLDLGTREGVARLYGRIRAAAVSVCALSDVHSELESRACEDHAVARAVRAVHNDHLSAYHWMRIWRRASDAPDDQT